MIKFDEWVKLKENMWGSIPVKGKKPSDGLSNGGMQAASPQQPMGQKMMKKMKKKMEDK